MPDISPVVVEKLALACDAVFNEYAPLAKKVDANEAFLKNVHPNTFQTIVKNCKQLEYYATGVDDAVASIRSAINNGTQDILVVVNKEAKLFKNVKPEVYASEAYKLGNEFLGKMKDYLSLIKADVAKCGLKAFAPLVVVGLGIFAYCNQKTPVNTPSA